MTSVARKVCDENKPAGVCRPIEFRHHASPSIASLWTDLNRPPLIAVAFDPHLAASPVTSGRQMGVGCRRRISSSRRRRAVGPGWRWRAIGVWRWRIITRRRWRIITGRRRRAVGDCATDYCAGRDAPENACADGATDAISNRWRRSGHSGERAPPNADHRNERLMHTFSQCRPAGWPIRSPNLCGAPSTPGIPCRPQFATSLISLAEVWCLAKAWRGGSSRHGHTNLIAHGRGTITQLLFLARCDQ